MNSSTSGDLSVLGGNTSSVYLTDIEENEIRDMVPMIIQAAWDNLTVPLSSWQKSQLAGLEEPGVSCLLNMWFLRQRDLPSGNTYCNATWDNFYCWPPSPNGTVVTRHCSDILQVADQSFAHHIQGNAVRVCQENGTWQWGNWTNYTQCADSYEEYIKTYEEERALVVTVQHILFVGSILSLVCLGTALTIFCYFRCLRCDRVTVHIHLMIALLLRCTLLIVITEPFIFNRTSHYRNVDVVCKSVLSINLYATVASVNWMFLQGVYLHGKLTTNVFDRETPFKIYYTIGWILPLMLIGIYAATMEIFHPVQCWKDYSDRSEIWILLGPMIFALLANFLFLINIMRILLTKVQRTNASSDAVQFRRAVKATIVLFPLLGINNLFFLHNPGGEYNKFFVVFNTVFGSTQGIFVSILYCFVSKDVRDAIYRKYRRYTARRSANLMRGSQLPKEQNGAIGGHVNSIGTRIHFQTKTKNTGSKESSQNSGTIQAANNGHQHSRQSSSLRTCYCKWSNGSSGTFPANNGQNEQHLVSIPLAELRR